MRLVARREIDERLRSKSYRVITVLLVVVIVAVGVVSRLVGATGSDDVKIGVTGSSSAGLDDAVVQSAEAFDRDAEVVTFDDGESARRAVDDGDVDAAVDADEGELVFAGDADGEAQAIVQQAWASSEIRRSLVSEGLTEAQADEVLSPPPLEVVTLDDGRADGLAVLTGTVTAVLLFISLQTFGGYVLTGVVEEKSTAVVELLLVRLRADQLLAGKIVGIGLVGLVQFALTVVAGLVALAISGGDVPSAVWSALPVTILWFLGGYAFYATLFALAGSLVSRQEDAQAAAAPIMTAMVGGYLLVFAFGYVPDSTASTVLSLIPPIAPFLMPMRMAAGAASAVEVVVALALLLAAIVGVSKLAGRIYAQVLLRRGTRISWREALTAVARG